MSDEDFEKPREIDLEKAHTSLREVMASLGLADGDREVFADQIREVEQMMQKLEDGVIHIATFGMVSRGKSALLNALLGREVFAIGATHGTTRTRQSTRWALHRETVADCEVETFTDTRRDGVAIELIDTPGLNEVDGEERARLAREIARRADLILFVVSGDMLRPELEALAELREVNKPIVLVFNMIDLYPEADRGKIYDKIRNERVRELLKPEDVVLAAAQPRPVKVITRAADGSTAEVWEQPEPVIVSLKLKILEVLEREGQALAALNTMLYVGDLHQEIIERRLQLREQGAEKLIWRFTITKAAAVALNPIPVADVAGGIGTDIAMVFALARMYGIPMTRMGVGKLVIQIGKMAGVFTATEVGTHFLIGIAKSFFGATALFTGGASIAAYATVAPIQAFAAGYASRVIGEATKIYLRNGASWGPAGPKTVIQHILNTLDKDSIMQRIKEELQARLHTG
ncbi:MAG: GTP-binding protein [Phycisphaerae bacterium]|nr:GTP-binding protein [Phycisphaerae bacterium]